MKYTKLESLQRKKAALVNELAQIDQNLHSLDDESVAAKEKLNEARAAVCGRVLYRLMLKKHEANPAVAEAELLELSKILVNRRERKAFGLPPLPIAGRDHGAASV